MAFPSPLPTQTQQSLRRAGGVTVEWLRDQSRPFSFTVSKSRGARPRQMATADGCPNGVHRSHVVR